MEKLLIKGKITREEYERFLGEPPMGFGYLLNRLVGEGKLTPQEANEYFNNYRGRGFGKGWSRGFRRDWTRGWKHRFGFGWNF